MAALAHRHRVEGLVWRSLSALDLPVPAPVAENLSSAAREIARAGMVGAVEYDRLAQGFEAAGISLLFLKGLTLGKLAYGDSFIKMGWDIDLLVGPAQVGRAAACLADLGYESVIPADPRSVEAWHSTSKESVWRKAGSSIFVELHDRLSDSPALIPAIDVSSNSQLVEIAPGLKFPTLADTELFAYLSVHGSSSAWFRLKWITDMAAFLHNRSPSEIGRLYDFAVRSNAGRTAAQALLLANAVYGTDIGRSLRHKLGKDRSTRWLVRTGLLYLFGPISVREPTQVFLGTLPIKASQLLLRPGIAFKWAEARRQFAALGSPRS